jgi:hypothetical protein
METQGILWVRSVLAVYRQAAVDAAREGIDPQARAELIESLGQAHTRFTAHEELDALWRQGFGGSETGVRGVFAPLVAAALACNPDSPIRALVEFAAEEIAAVCDGE